MLLKKPHLLRCSGAHVGNTTQRSLAPRIWVFLSSLLLMFLPICSAAGFASAADGGFEVSFSISKQKASVGDEIIIAADVVHDENFKIEDLPSNLKLNPFIVKRVERVAPKKAKGIVADGFRIAITVFDVGKFTVPRVAIRFKDPKGKAGVVYTDTWPVEVFSVLGAQKDTGDIRPLKGPESLETDAERRHRLLMWVLSMLGLLVLGLLGWWGWKRYEIWRESKKTPAQRALEAIVRLEKKALLPAGQAKLFYSELTDILKIYVIREFKVGSLEATSREFVASVDALAPSAAGAGSADRIKKILDAADLVKFAKSAPTAEESREIVTEVQRLVTETSAAASAVKPARGGKEGKKRA